MALQFVQSNAGLRESNARPNLHAMPPMPEMVSTLTGHGVHTAPGGHRANPLRLPRASGRDCQTFGQSITKRFTATPAENSEVVDGMHSFQD